MKLIYDVVHGHIGVNSDDLTFIDNLWMKRLKRVKQLGLLDHIFPNASHTRFEHSLGVYHLADEYINYFEKNSHTKLFSEKEKRCVKLAGLYHDIGHGPFSHVFDNEIINNYSLTDDMYLHESRSKWIVEEIFREQQPSGFNGYDIELIKDLIEPNKTKKEKPYLFQIINNKQTGLDIDKFDYMMRDNYHLGLDYNITPQRIFLKSKINPETKNINYHFSIASNIFNVYSNRYKLYREVYCHQTVKTIETMLADAMKQYEPLESMLTKDNFIKLDDSIYTNILFSDCQSSKSILERIEKRDLYNTIYFGNVSDSPCLSKRTVDFTLNFCNQERNPMLNVPFYGKEGFIYNELLPDKFENKLRLVLET